MAPSKLLLSFATTTQALLVVLSLVVGFSAAALRTRVGYTVYEGNDPGYVVGHLIRDTGLGEHYPADMLSKLRFAFLDPTAARVDLFNLDANTGVLTLARSVDRDELCPFVEKCDIPVAIQVQPDFRIIRVTVAIEDINDNTPVFPEAVIRRTLQESAPVGSRIPLPPATDRDSPRFNIDTYYLRDPSPVFRVLVQNASMAPDSGNKLPTLVTTQALDREEQSFYSLIVVAMDGGGTRPKTATLNVNVEVLDVNDHTPQFVNHTYAVWAREDSGYGTTLLRVHATDPDVGINGRVTYGMTVPGSNQGQGYPFVMNTTTGDIVLSGELDREQLGPSVTLTATAKDGDPNSFPSSVAVVINIIDINDNAPVIRIPSLETGSEIFVSEGQDAGAYVVYVSVSDPDAGRNGEITCTVRDTNFELVKIFDNEYKIVTRVILDREYQAYYNIQMTCRDSGSPSRTASVPIAITVQDMNDHAPRFSQPLYQLSVLENNDPGASVGKLYVGDRDTGPNGELNFRVVRNPNTETSPETNPDLLFRIDHDGSVYARTMLDREDADKISFIVEAIDQGEPKLTGSTTVVVEVLDLDDELPEFTQQGYTFAVFENQKSGTKVDQVIAVDRDTDQFNKFTLRLENPRKEGGSTIPFQLDPNTGWIHTTAELDREATPTFEMSVLAITSGTHPQTSTASVTIYVADKNDHSPVVNFPVRFNNSVFLSNGLDRGTFVTRIEATDNDGSGINSRLSYFITTGNINQYFDIDEATGVVTVNRSLSKIRYETFALEIVVSDNGDPPRTASSMLFIVVNESLAIPGEKHTALVPHKNLAIAIVIACVTGVLIVVLAVAIAAIVRQQRRLANEREYDQVKRGETTKLSQGHPAAWDKRHHCLQVGFAPDKPANSEPRPPSKRDYEPGNHNLTSLSPKNPVQLMTDKPRQEVMVRSDSKEQPVSILKSPVKNGADWAAARPRDDVDNISIAGGSDVTDSGRGSSEDVGIRAHGAGSSHRSRPLPPERTAASGSVPSAAQKTPYSPTSGPGFRPAHIYHKPSFSSFHPPPEPTTSTPTTHASSGTGYPPGNTNSAITLVPGKTNAKCTKCDGDGPCCYGSYV